MNAYPAFDDDRVAGPARAGALFVSAPGPSWVFRTRKHDKPLGPRHPVTST